MFCVIQEIEIFELNGQVLFNPKHVAKCLGIADVKSSIRNFNDKQVIKLTNSKVQNMHFRKLHNTGEIFLSECGVYKLAFRSHEPQAEQQKGILIKTGNTLSKMRIILKYRRTNFVPRLILIWMKDNKMKLCFLQKLDI